MNAEKRRIDVCCFCHRRLADGDCQVIPHHKPMGRYAPRAYRPVEIAIAAARDA